MSTEQIGQQIISIVNYLSREKNWSQKQIAAQTALLAKVRPEANEISCPQLSKAINYEKNILGEGSLRKIYKTLALLEEYVKQGKDFKEDIRATGKLRHLVGLYEMYHQSEKYQHLLKNILEIQALDDTSGLVRIKPAYGDALHFGKLYVFQDNYVSIFIEKVGKNPFFYNILFRMSGYIDTGMEVVTHFWASSTTVSLDAGPMANIRILCPIKNKEASFENQKSQLIDMQSENYNTLCEEKTFLQFFKNNPNKIICDYKVNQHINHES